MGEVKTVKLRNGQVIKVERQTDQSAWVWLTPDRQQIDTHEGSRKEFACFKESGAYYSDHDPSPYDIVDWDAGAPSADAVNHPAHYTSHPADVECITVTEHMPFNVGNVFKYLWRAGLKENAPTDQDYNKAVWYLLREMRRQGVKLTVAQDVIEGLR